ncbi:DUF99 family protein [Candidatus Woesearchaeota archaeon]|nr:DUF99 family protein [Candidatus Woesearchaeota archaeon]
MKIKKQTRILGIDDCPFKRKNKYTQIIGTVFRAGEYVDGLLSSKISVDGFNATDKIIQMIKKSRNKGQLRIIMLDGIALGGFNIIDIQKLYKKTKLPVIVVIRRRPNFKKIKLALNHLSKPEKRLQLMKNAGKIYEFPVKHKGLRKKGKIYFQYIGITEKQARQVLKLTITHGLIPEPIRVAHLIATGIKLGESRGRA